jgi:hypothetical protein
MPTDLVTIEQFAGYLKRDLDEFDAYSAQQLLDGAAAAVVEYCGWHIAPVLTETVTVDGSGTRIQPLPTLNLISLDAVAERGRPHDPGWIDWSVNGLLEKRSGGMWTARRRGVVAEITHGYAATPGWLLTLICALAGRAYITPAGIAQEAAGGESVTYAVSRTVPPATVALLDIDRRMLDRIAIPRPA